MIPRWLGWPIFALVMGFVLGGSVLWGSLYVPPEQYAARLTQQTETSAGRHKTQNPEADHTGSTWLTKDASGFFTFWLVLVGGIQVGMFFTQLKYMRKGMDDTAKAAEATALSAKAAVALELPIIRITPDNKIGFGDAVEFGVQTHTCHLYNVTFVNAGRTKAFPTEIAWGWTFGDRLPVEPLYTGTTKFGTGYILKPEIADIVSVDASGEIPADGYNQLRGGTAQLWFYCRLTYLDFMDTSHTVGFCWQRFETIGGGRFIRDETPAYNRKI